MSGRRIYCAAWSEYLIVFAPRLHGLAVAWVLAPVVGLALGCPVADAAEAAPLRAPYIPQSDDEVLQEVPSAADPAVINMRRLRTELDATPHALPAALRLAGAYVDYSRQIGDAHYAGYA
jgi:hypothetical protein